MDVAVETTGYQSTAAGWVEDPETFWPAEKERMLAELGDLRGVDVLLNRILVAIWVRPGERRVKGSSLVITYTDETKDEDKWQGVSGLVVKVGPHAFEPNEYVAFTEDDKVRPGDWVMMQRGSGVRVKVNNWECYLLLGEKAVLMKIPRPDMTY